jgi:hypothetical protein
LRRWRNGSLTGVGFSTAARASGGEPLAVGRRGGGACQLRGCGAEVNSVGVLGSDRWTGGGWEPAVNGELLVDGEAVGAVTPLSTMVEGFTRMQHNGMRRWKKLKVGGGWLVSDGEEKWCFSSSTGLHRG